MPAHLPSICIRKFEAHSDSSRLYELWHRALPPKWSISQEELLGRLRSATICYVAVEESGTVGFCAVAHRPAAATAALLVLLVDPSTRRQGHGSALLQSVERALSQQGVTRLSLGFAGEGNYFWQGVPVDSGSWPFFVRNGWRESETSSDLLLNLRNFTAPRWVLERSDEAEVAIHPASVDLQNAVLRFERLNFPLWAQFFEGAQGYCESNVIVASNSSGTIVGSVLLSSSLAIPWKHALGNRCGSLGVLGVAKHMEGRGIGLALAACGAELLRGRGCSACHIGWTGLIDWYGKLGATPWATYHMGHKILVQRPT